MERMVFRWLTGAGMIAAFISIAADLWGSTWLPARPAAEPTTQITVLVIERNGAKVIPSAVCTVAQVGE